MTRYGYLVCKNYNAGNHQANQPTTVSTLFKKSSIFPDSDTFSQAGSSPSCAVLLLFTSYGGTFPPKCSQKPELFSKMKFSIDLGIFVCQRYMLIVLGKIAKCTQRRLEAVVKYDDHFSLGFLQESGDHLPGERDVRTRHISESC